MTKAKRNRDPRLDLAMRKQRGRRLAPEWLARLSSAVDFQPPTEDFLGLEDTMRLKQGFVSILRAGQAVTKSFVAAFSHERMFETMKSWAGVGPPRVALFSSIDQYIGALLVPPSVVLAHVKEVWEVVGEDLSMCSDDLSHGLCLELNFYDEANRYVADGEYQMTGWGAFADLAATMDRSR